MIIRVIDRNLASNKITVVGFMGDLRAGDVLEASDSYDHRGTKRIGDMKVAAVGDGFIELPAHANALITGLQTGDYLRKIRESSVACAGCDGRLLMLADKLHQAACNATVRKDYRDIYENIAKMVGDVVGAP